MTKFNKTYYKQADIVLLTMPGTLITRPSLGLSVLKASLSNTNYNVDILYANILFEETIARYSSFWNITPFYKQLQEWAFSNMLFPDYTIDNYFYLKELSLHFLSRAKVQPTEDNIRKCIRIYKEIRRKAELFVDSFVDLVLYKNPRIVGCSSVFYQHVSSLVILKILKEKRPEIITVMGGPNCTGEMGITTLQKFEFVDFIFSGEADNTFPVFVTEIFTNPNQQEWKFPASVISNNKANNLLYLKNKCNSILFNRVKNLDNLPTPDFSDYFFTYNNVAILKDIEDRVVQMEASRGCWWFEKVGCTFCGLNPGDKKYRSKSPLKVIKEMDTVYEQYKPNLFKFTDNILNMYSLNEFANYLIETQPKYELFFEVKANLNRENVKLLSQAKIVHVQAGIESLHDEVLQLMKKGTTVIKNIQFLKYAIEFSIDVNWIFLHGFPNEKMEWYSEMCSYIHLFSHLQPPGSNLSIGFQRFSEYFVNQKKYNLQLKPLKYYKYIYPFDEKIISKLVGFFEDRTQQEVIASGVYINIKKAILAWRNEYFSEKGKPILQMRAKHEEVHIIDTRKCAIKKHYELTGEEALIIINCEPAITKKQLYIKLAKKIAIQKIDTVLNELVNNNLVFSYKNKYLNLVIPK